MRWVVVLTVPLSLAAQDAYFKETPANPWLPAWELTLRADRIDEPAMRMRLVERESARIRLKWTWEAGPWSGSLGTWSALGSDSNSLNIWRYDQQPSDGTRLDAAWIQARGATEAGFLELRLGHQENPLLAQESLWDKDLRVTGASLRAGFRSETIQELGFRGVAGRVRTLPDGKVMLAAAQVVARFDTGPVSWTAHAGHWELRWDASDHRERALPDGVARARQKLSQDVAGVGATLHVAVPLEVKTIRHRDPVSRDDGAEFQVWIGSRNRPWWPQAGYVWQRFEPRGTFHPVNGDDWWFMTNARGPRYEVALPLPRKWLIVATYLQHHSYMAWSYPVDRRLLQVIKRF